MKLRLCLLAAMLVGACISPSEPPPVRWFSLEPEALTEVAVAEAAQALEPRDEPTPLRLRRATSAAHLGERFVWRRGAELGFLDGSRWTEAPIAYVERALARALFESGAFVRSESSLAPSLDVELTAFDWIRSKPARVRIAWTLRLQSRTGGTTRFERSFEQEERLPPDAGSSEVVIAWAESLRKLIEISASEVASVHAFD